MKKSELTQITKSYWDFYAQKLTYINMEYTVPIFMRKREADICFYLAILKGRLFFLTFLFLGSFFFSKLLLNCHLFSVGMGFKILLACKRCNFPIRIIFLRNGSKFACSSKSSFSSFPDTLLVTLSVAPVSIWKHIVLTTTYLKVNLR